jgi:hypothetical protein
MQVTYHNLEYLSAALQTFNQRGPNARVDMHLEQRLKLSTDSIMRSLGELNAVLCNLGGEYSALDSFFVRVLAPSLQKECEKARSAAETVEHLAQGTLRRIEKGTFDVPDHSVEQLKRMLRVGMYTYLSMPVPACVIEHADDKPGDGGAGVWNRSAAAQHKRASEQKQVRR